MNLNFIEPVNNILQPITIRNISDDNNIKPHAIKGLVKFKKLVFLHSALKSSAHNFVFGPQVRNEWSIHQQQI